MTTEAPTQPDIIRLDNIDTTATTRIAALTAALDNLLRESKGLFDICASRRKGRKKNAPHWSENNAIRYAAEVLASSDMDLITHRHEEQALSTLFRTLLEQGAWDATTQIVQVPVLSVGVHPQTAPSSPLDAVMMALALGQPVGLVLNE
jgi:hypothetical protein